MNDTPEQIEATIAALEAQRGLLGDAVVDSALAPLRRELASQRAPQSAARQQLKQVSVLFVDVVGSTAMGQRLEPEDIHAVMDTALERFSAIVQANRGRVLQYTGDGMLAAFGADVAHEDDAESAVRAGLGIIEEAQRQAPRVRQAHGVPAFDVRAGINTGTVLLGGGVDADGSIRGAVVNVAARMEQSAPSGRLRISHDTYRLVSGVFEVAEQSPISVKGVDAPVRSYLVERVRPNASRATGRGVEGVTTRLIGRDRELAALQAAFDDSLARHALRSIAVVGEAGIGKSRLISEFQRALRAGDVECSLLLGRAYPRSRLQPFDLLRDLLTRHFQIGDDSVAARSKWVDAMAGLFGDAGESAAHLLGQLIGLDFSSSPHLSGLLNDASQLRERAFDVAAQFLRRLAQRSGAPVVIVLDDLHWADDGSLDFIDWVLQAHRDMPVLMLMFTRPDLIERRPEWAAGEAAPARLDLAPLDRDLSNELANALLQRIAQAPQALRALITSGAEGNPFYMEELVKMLIDDGVIATDGDGWRVLADKLLRVRVPPTLTGVLQARLDALEPDERCALQQAAVVGQVFTDEVLCAVDPQALHAVPSLLRKHLIVHHDAPDGAGRREYAFQHNLLHQVTYDGVLRPQKRAGHAKAGQFWSTRAEVGGPQEVDPSACRALVEAHFHRSRSDPQAYVAWFEGQFFNYLNAYAAQTLRPLSEAIVGICEEQFGVDHPETAKALTNLARVALGQCDVETAEPLLSRAVAIQEKSLGADHADTARTVAVLGGYFAGRGDLRAAEPYFRRALALRERALGAEHPLTVGTLDNLASAVGELGRYDEAESLSRRVLEIRERVLGPDHPDTAFALTALADVLSKKNAHAQAEPLLRRALEAQQKKLHAEHPHTGLSMWNLAEALRGLGRYAEAEPVARRCVEVWEKSLGPNHQWTAWGLGSLAKLRLVQSDAAEAAQLAERALHIHERTLGPNHETIAQSLFTLAQALAAQGEHEDAEPLLVRALAIQANGNDGEASFALTTQALLQQVRAQLASH